MTVLWHVDDLKISCRDGFEVTKLMKHLDKVYGESWSLTEVKREII